ncbi:hypothetical protein HDU96_009306 [Phlyctochytrium bullatum]|nr:hypothetical protein HDU96_009306 [Phlyctochytrium bullatum]
MFTSYAADFVKRKCGDRLLSSRPSFCPYKTLGVSKSADQSTIKKAYLQLVMENHPDKFHSRISKQEAERRKEKFQNIVSSFEILSSPLKRKEYDFEASMGGASYSSRGSSRQYHPTSGFSTPRGPGWGQAYGADSTGGAWGYNDPSIWRGEMNKGPLYMSNGKMAALIVLLAAAVGTLFFQLAMIRSRSFTDFLNQRDEELRLFYDDRKKKASSQSYEEATRPLRERAQQIIEEERMAAQMRVSHDPSPPQEHQE